MARATKQKRAKHKVKRSRSKNTPLERVPNRAFWSGTLSFGLVNVPVLVFPASRHAGVRLRLLSPDGALLERRFYCPKDGSEVGPDEIIRGFELDDGAYITVKDRELDEIEPQKTREIDLRRFVDLSEISPAFLERGYFLTPAAETTKAYRLLAEALERTRRAGIATFVMREREYLVAICARGGILCAETLRFQDELRDPKSIGLPEAEPAPRERVIRFERAIDALSARAIARAELADRDTARLRALIDKKHRAGKDIVHTGARSREPESDGEAVVDLLEMIRSSLRPTRTSSTPRRRPFKPSRTGTGGAQKRMAARDRKTQAASKTNRVRKQEKR
jgi:DNA end-binding protein Ku